jgi:Glutathione S-transferase, N-terminal domain
MTLQLFGHPFSSYTQKALIALYENGTPFAFRMLGPDEQANGAEADDGPGLRQLRYEPSAKMCV